MRKYSWIPDTPDFRDLLFEPPHIVEGLPSKVDLREKYTNVYDQGEIGSCTANALCNAFDFVGVKEGKKPVLPSRLFLYYDERRIEGTTGQDAGAMIRDGAKTFHGAGVCPEFMWPYDQNLLFNQPTHDCYNHAANHRTKEYKRLNNLSLNDLKACLAAGYPFVFGFSVYESFESDAVTKTGVVPMPKPTERLLGGHAVLALGYDDENKWVIVRNSWGEEWGDKGHFYLPYDYITNPNLADDFWTIRLV